MRNVAVEAASKVSWFVVATVQKEENMTVDTKSVATPDHLTEFTIQAKKYAVATRLKKNKYYFIL